MKMFETGSPDRRSYQRFAAPEDILVDRQLAGDERRRLLDEWKLELELLATATAENMGDQTGASPPEELLRRVNACRRLLSESEEEN
jgi:hypothetical protein